MRIISLIAQNVKRISAVEITPTGDIVEISGENGAGKSSILDCIFWALAGTANVQAEPIRRGADSATIKLDLGEFKVTRKFKRQEHGKHTTSLIVERPDGGKYGQTVLDSLLSGLTFDPLGFSKMKPAEQFNMLRQFVPGMDFAAIATQNKADFDKRTEENRRAKEAKAAGEAIVIPANLPDEQDEAELVDQIANAGEHNASIDRQVERRSTLQHNANALKDRGVEHRNRASDLREQADEQDRLASLRLKEAADLESEIDHMDPTQERRDATALRTQLAVAQTNNRVIARAAEDTRKRTSLLKVADDAKARADALTAAIEKRETDKQAAIAAAQMPVDGLGFGDGFVTLNGVPFEQGSDAEQLRASVAIAMQMNPKLKVIRVRDGSLLDDNSMRLLAEMAAANGHQVWVETVRPTSSDAIIIEDGHVREVPVAEESAA
jgi:ABC-type cobalamin/Fe3+-siderophores transport system ATPase subunit